MSRHGISDKLASEMGHLDQSSKGGIKDTLTSLEKPRKILIHINNTNPILDEESDERKVLDDAGIEVSYDGDSEDLDGLTFYVPEPENVRLYLNGCAVAALDRNGPDQTGKASISIPWRPLEFPAL